MEAREGEVKDAGASIVGYERWRVTQDDAELESIRKYNEDDCRSTQLLRDWLLGLRPAEAVAHAGGSAEAEGGAGGRGASERIIAIETELEQFRELLVAGAPKDRATWSEEHRVRELVYLLLNFHRRAAKPEWWAMFARQEMAEDDLIDDLGCLGRLRLVGNVVDENQGAKSRVYRYAYPDQETKLREGSGCTRCDTSASFGVIVAMDEEARTVDIRVGPRLKEVPDAVSIGPSGPISAEPLRKALIRFAESLVAGDERFAATKALLRKKPPKLTGRVAGAPIVDPAGEIAAEATAAVLALDRSYVFIQGPPGAGKTYTGSKIIVELLRCGKRVGVASNSHKAIHNLLAAVVERAQGAGIGFSGAKKCTSGDPETQFDGVMFENFANADELYSAQADLVAGTAWLFANPIFEETLDYLFVDEAGQVALANLIGMGTAANNIVLLGDQMQLGQPIQGVHPERSGDSTLDYLLDGVATTPPDRGIFLPTTWRMHDDVCRFISDAVYDSRLHPESKNRNQQLMLANSADPILRSTGVVFADLAHEGRAQRCPEEAELVASLYERLLAARYRDRDGREFPMAANNIMIVAPYNSQVNHLKSTLPVGARVGTIDKFQGQEAEVVLISMTTSSGDFLPRNISFLYDKNRLNVAMSRAKCLAVVIASPALLHVHCNTPEEMELVNTLCWVKEYSEMAVEMRGGD